MLGEIAAVAGLASSVFGSAWHLRKQLDERLDRIENAQVLTAFRLYCLEQKELGRE